MTGRTRRSTETVRSAVLQAAQELFAERGYASTSTKEIASRAQVSEPLLFRHYGSKAALFEIAVLGRLERFVVEYTADWDAETEHLGAGPEYARAYVGGLYDLLCSQKGLVMAAMTAQAYEAPFDGTGEGSPGLGVAIQGLFTRLEDLARRGWTERGRPGEDPTLGVRFTFGLVLSAAVFDTWILPKDSLASRDAIVTELTGFMLHGFAGRPAPAR
jgi:AcrR family transcriptional regulator